MLNSFIADNKEPTDNEAIEEDYDVVSIISSSTWTSVTCPLSAMSDASLVNVDPRGVILID